MGIIQRDSAHKFRVDYDLSELARRFGIRPETSIVARRHRVPDAYGLKRGLRHFYERARTVLNMAFDVEVQPVVSKPKKSLFEKIVPIPEEFYDADRDEDLVAPRSTILPMIGFLRFIQLCALMAFLLYYTLPVSYVYDERVATEWNYGSGTYNCTPMMKDHFYESYLQASTCEADAAQPADSMVDLTSGWGYKPFPYWDELAGFSDEFDELAGVNSLYSTTEAAKTARENFFTHLRTLTSCGADGDAAISYRYHSFYRTPWIVQNFDGYWQDGSNLTGFPLTAAAGGGTCVTYSESDINDLVNPNSCYYNHSYPSMRNLFAYIGVPEHTEIRAALSSNPGACQWGCHTVADVGCTHDKPYNGRNLSTVCCANSYCYGGAPMGGRGEAGPRLRYNRSKRFVGCHVSKAEAQSIFEAWRNAHMCNFGKTKQNYKCTGSNSRPPLEVLSLAYSNALFLYSTFSTIAIWLRFRSAGCLGRLKTWFKRHTKVAKAESEKQRKSFLEKFIPINGMLYEGNSDEDLVAPKKKVLRFVTFLRVIQVCSFGAFVMYYYWSPMSFKKDVQFTTRWDYGTGAYNCTLNLPDEYWEWRMNYDTCKQYVLPPNNSTLIDWDGTSFPFYTGWKYKPFLFSDKFAGYYRRAWYHFGNVTAIQRTRTDFVEKLKTLNEAGTDGGFDALDGCPACGPQYGVWTINSGDVTREEALNMFTALYDDDHVCGYAKSSDVSYYCEGSFPLPAVEIISLAYANSLLIFTAFSIICVWFIRSTGGHSHVKNDIHDDSVRAQVALNVPNTLMTEKGSEAQKKSFWDKILPITSEFYAGNSDDDLVAPKNKILPLAVLLFFIQACSLVAFLLYYSLPVSYEVHRRYEERYDYNPDVYNCTMMTEDADWKMKLNPDACNRLASAPSPGSSVTFDDAAWSYTPFSFHGRVVSIDQTDFDDFGRYATQAAALADRDAFVGHLKTLNSVGSDGGYMDAFFNGQSSSGWYINSTTGITQSEALSMFQAYYNRKYVCMWTENQSLFVCDGKLPREPLIVMSLAYSNALLLHTVLSFIVVKIFLALFGKAHI